MNPLPVSEETAQRIAAALERIAAAAEAQAAQEPVSFPNAPVLAKGRSRAGGRGR